jgi:hypothetical protein
MDLPFSRIEFLQNFAAYNIAIWPTQVVAAALGVIAILLLFWRPSTIRGRMRFARRSWLVHHRTGYVFVCGLSASRIASDASVSRNSAVWSCSMPDNVLHPGLLDSRAPLGCCLVCSAAVSRTGRVDWQPPVRENPFDQLRLLNARNHFQAPTATHALLDLDPERAL